MTAAIYYQSDAYSTSGKKLMGRNAAGESFLRAFVRSQPAAEKWAFVDTPAEGEAFTEMMRSLGNKGGVRVINKDHLADLSKPGTLFRPGPNLSRNAWQRSWFGARSWSLCGITHTIASGRVMNGLVDLLTAPIETWDALICTSNAVRSSVETVLDAQARYLTERLGAKLIPLPKLPVIPLGLNTQDFDYTPDQRSEARTKLRIRDDEDVVLFIGRLSFHAKAHPLAMYQALERAQSRRRTTGRKTVLIECGWHTSENVAQAFAEARRVACPSIRVIDLDGRSAPDRQAAWASADMLCSLVDNIQETFGIVPVEAMAAGLPVVVSDWDGYRDTVRDGVDGFRIPTVAPMAGLGEDLARRHALEIDTYDWHLAYTSSFAAVDVEAASKAISTLLESPETRLRFGEAGRRRAREVYDWTIILGAYEQLWQELAEIRKSNLPHQEKHRSLSRMDPFRVFSGYPTTALTRDTMVRLSDPTIEEAMQRLKQYLELRMVVFAGPMLPKVEEIQALLTSLESGPKEAGQLIAALPIARQELCLRSLVWLAKLDLLRLANDVTGE